MVNNNIMKKNYNNNTNTKPPPPSSNSNANNSNSNNSSSRIPLSLQAVFLASNRGNDVHVAPPDSIASKLYFRNWLFNGNYGTSTGKYNKKGKDLNTNNNKTNHHRSIFSRFGGNNKNVPKRNTNTTKTISIDDTIATDVDGNDNDDRIITSTATSSPNKKNKKKNDCSNSNTTGTTKDGVTGIGTIPTKSIPIIVQQNPQQYLDALIRHRGYSTIRYKTLDTGYYYKPNELQLSSYDSYLIRLAKIVNDESNTNEFATIIQCGISPNPCNVYSESLVHTICRCSNVELLKIMITTAGTDVYVSDDYGRTPLHDACWSANDNIQSIFNVVQLLLSSTLSLPATTPPPTLTTTPSGVLSGLQQENNDGIYTNQGPTMFYMADCRGYVPLQYVTKQYWSKWIEFIEYYKDLYWPIRNRVIDGEQPVPILVSIQPNTRCAPIPITTQVQQPLDVTIAKMVVSGRMTPEEAILLHNEQTNDTDDDDEEEEDDDDDEEEEEDDDEDDSESDDDSDDDDDDDEDSYFDEEEMKNFIRFATTNNRKSGGGTSSNINKNGNGSNGTSTTSTTSLVEC